MKKEELIERYFQNEMSNLEKKNFENKLSMDKELLRLYNLNLDIQKALAETEVLLLRNQLDQIHTQMYGKSKVRVIPVYLRIASVITGILLISSLLLLQTRNLNNEEIYNQYFEPYESVIRVRSTEYSNNILSKAMMQYDAGNYYKAAQLFEQILEKEPDKAVVNLYSGISNMEIQEYNKANKSFNRIIKQNNNNAFIEQAEWYLGFCYLMTNENEKAKIQFESIADSNSFYSKKAKKISKKIKIRN